MTTLDEFRAWVEAIPYADPVPPMTFGGLALSVIAALEAEVARLLDVPRDLQNALDLMTGMRDVAEAEVARLKGRRCETCVNWVQQQHNAMFDCDIEACCEAFISPDFACSEWTAREEAGGE